MALAATCLLLHRMQEASDVSTTPGSPWTALGPWRMNHAGTNVVELEDVSLQVKERNGSFDVQVSGSAGLDLHSSSGQCV